MNNNLLLEAIKKERLRGEYNYSEPITFNCLIRIVEKAIAFEKRDADRHEMFLSKLEIEATNPNQLLLYFL